MNAQDTVIKCLAIITLFMLHLLRIIAGLMTLILAPQTFFCFISPAPDPHDIDILTPYDMNYPLRWNMLYMLLFMFSAWCICSIILAWLRRPSTEPRTWPAYPRK